jgi:hypothetical protein
MLDDVAAYLVLAPVLGQLAALALAVIWLARDCRVGDRPPEESEGGTPRVQTTL